MNRLFAFAKLDLAESPIELAPLDLSEALRHIVDGYDAENLDGGGLCVTLTLPRAQEG